MESWSQYLPQIVATATVVGAVGATTIHVVMRKPDPRAAMGWLALVWLSPVVGVVLYLLLGINRIKRQAKTLRQNLPSYDLGEGAEGFAIERLDEVIPGAESLVTLARVGQVNIERPLVGGNEITPLFNGDQAYPEMIAAIDSAQVSVTFASYIFDNDTIGRQFADAFERATQRGVEVRVMVDAAGSRYSLPSIVWALKRRGVPVAKFLPSSLFPPYILSANLRNHRKVMVVDGKYGFTGGMNIRDDCVLENDPGFPTRDLHFRVRGPVVMQLQEVFAEDWTFTTGEELTGEAWFPEVPPAGDMVVRGIPDGPDEDIDKLRWTLLAAIGAARESIQIVTPYFLPDEPLVDALIVASMRGVRVDVVMPKKNNLPYVAWAALGQMYPLLAHNVNIWFEQGEFDHSKVAVVDEAWILLGSPNWDPRSLRLNFEFALECYSPALAEALAGPFAERIERSRRWTLEDHKKRNIFIRLRDGVFRLFAPYL